MLLFMRPLLRSKLFSVKRIWMSEWERESLHSIRGPNENDEQRAVFSIIFPPSCCRRAAFEMFVFPHLQVKLLTLHLVDVTSKQIMLIFSLFFLHQLCVVLCNLQRGAKSQVRPPMMPSKLCEQGDFWEKLTMTIARMPDTGWDLTRPD